MFRRGPSHLLAWSWAGYELEEVILVSISVRVEHDFKAKQKHLPHPPPQPPDVTVSLIFTRWDWWEHRGTQTPLLHSQKPERAASNGDQMLHPYQILAGTGSGHLSDRGILGAQL